MSAAPPGARRIALSHGALFLREGGGPCFLCIPGGYHGAWCFAPWMAAFARAGFAAAALDPRGKGSCAARPDPGAGIATYAEDAAEAAGMLARPVVLVGHSLGALVAMAAAEQVGALAGLVLAAPSPPGNLPGAAPVPLVSEGAMLAPPDEAAVVARYFGGTRPAGIAAYCRALGPESPRALNDRYGLRITVDPARLAGVPALVLEAGRDDPERHPPGQDGAIARFLGARHQLLPQAPHVLMAQPWAQQSAAAILAWWDQAAKGSSGPP